VGRDQRREVGAGLEEIVVLARLHDHAVLHHLDRKGCACRGSDDSEIMPMRPRSIY
jgi:hypothetical protein